MLSPHYFPSWWTPALNPWMNGPVLYKLSPDTQRIEWHKQHSNTAKQESLFSLIFSVFPPLKPPITSSIPPDERQALPQTESSPVISTGALSGWEKCDWYKMKGRLETSVSVFTGKISFAPPFVHFVSSVCFVFKVPHYVHETSFGQHLKMHERLL